MRKSNLGVVEWVNISIRHINQGLTGNKTFCLSGSGSNNNDPVNDSKFQSFNCVHFRLNNLGKGEKLRLYTHALRNSMNERNTSL